ncbi:hypothetical protein ILYODFUR_035092 [Ilyodon furcidens]|uniref:Uncharacterized protein n=1 Tax=Ilyodon furcidens TaxID=33524 RepID=A0ABV0TDP1_9TELE
MMIDTEKKLLRTRDPTSPPASMSCSGPRSGGSHQGHTYRCSDAKEQFDYLNQLKTLKPSALLQWSSPASPQDQSGLQIGPAAGTEHLHQLLEGAFTQKQLSSC